MILKRNKWKSIQFNEKHFESMKIYEHLFKYMKINENQLQSTSINIQSMKAKQIKNIQKFDFLGFQPMQIICFRNWGTFHAALAHGKPNGIISFVCDHPFWGQVFTTNHLGATCSARYCTVSKLTKVVNRLFDEEVENKCKEVQTKLVAEENGTEVHLSF